LHIQQRYPNAPHTALQGSPRAQSVYSAILEKRTRRGDESLDEKLSPAPKYDDSDEHKFHDHN